MDARVVAGMAARRRLRDMVSLNPAALTPEPYRGSGCGRVVSGSGKAAAEEARSGQGEAPRRLGALGQTDARANEDVRGLGEFKLEGRLVEWCAVLRAGDAQRLAKAGR